MIMERTEMSIEMKKMLSVAKICMLLLLTVVATSWGDQEENAIRRHCTFSKYLENPANKTRYKNTVAKARNNYVTVSNYENPAMYGVIAKASFNSEDSENLDSFSAGCLSCHDGKTASNVRANFINSPDKKNKMIRISGKHPIGMDYEQYASANKNLKSLDEISIHLTLAEGRVSCITCHDPLNKEQNHLVVTRSGADLCSACHNM
jgi:hypothetical protein